MFERFTEEARQVIVLAQEEARALNHAYIGTEHLLLGLLRQEEAKAGRSPLQTLGIGLSETREAVVGIVGAGEGPPSGQIPFTPRAKKVLELSLREALGLGHNWIGPEHILLGLTCENEGVAGRILLDFGADSGKLRDLAIEVALSRPAPPPSTLGVRRHSTQVPIDPDWLDGLRDVLRQVGPEIRHELGRDPDIGDLLLAIACAPETLAGEALRTIGVDLDAVWGTLERIRQQQAEQRASLVHRIEEVRVKKELAIENQEFAEAAQLRDEQRELTREARSRSSVSPDVAREIRRRLGLSAPER